MPNMSYCRFQNTLGDLEACEEALDSGEPLSAEEHRAAKRLIGVCGRIAEMRLPPKEAE